MSEHIQNLLTQAVSCFASIHTNNNDYCVCMVCSDVHIRWIRVYMFRALFTLCMYFMPKAEELRTCMRLKEEEVEEEKLLIHISKLL